MAVCNVTDAEDGMLVTDARSAAWLAEASAAMFVCRNLRDDATGSVGQDQSGLLYTSSHSNSKAFPGYRQNMGCGHDRYRPSLSLLV